MSNNQSWPNLVGVPVDGAVEAIKSENPSLNVIPLAEGTVLTADLRLDRVRVFFDANNQVSSVPIIG
ncbi:unnamed protein product [Rotaria sordida]|uniref:Uncharacterized protein n=1 Tax=Rotaria sordida TaxID=392033 RepID=A0A820FLX4_9BILA|nr:unnamed protein product [Rotaria sordida]CAF4265287.1 unnamed protein product [Rotaria sordida]